MKKFIFTITVLASFALQAWAYDFQSGNLLYTIISTEPPCVSLDGHIDGTAAQGELIIPETVEYGDLVYTVSEVSNRAFFQCEGLNGVLVIPNTVKKIGVGAFGYCHGFTGNLQIPNSVTTIAVEAFVACDGFTGQLVIPNSVVSLGVEGGSGGVQYLGSFQGCTGLSGLTLSNSTSVIGEYCFAECNGLVGDLVIPEGVEELWQYAFWECERLSGVVFPSTFRVIGARAFQQCIGLKRLVIPETISEIYDNAFERCAVIEEIDLRCLAVWPGWNVFNKCTALSTVSLPEGMTKTGRLSFSECTGLTELELPESLQEIERGAFYECTGLSGDLKIPDRVERIELSAFYKSGYARVILGESLVYLSESAFIEMPFLQTLVLKPHTPPLLELCNYEEHHIPRDILIIVPCGTLEAYQNADGWSEFTNIHEGITDGSLVVSYDETAGRVSILKEALCEDRSVQVEAVPNEGYMFLNWEINGEVVSRENPFVFELEEDTELVAFFSGVGLEEGQTLFSIYPNPATDFVRIEGNVFTEVQIYNTLGQLVKKVQNTNAISVNDMTNGIYLLHISDTDGRNQIKRITVIK